jgi:DNA segregation ATPase FtsK/SpoIIIE, S-DNA-T family
MKSSLKELFSTLDKAKTNVNRLRGFVPSEINSLTDILQRLKDSHLNSERAIVKEVETHLPFANAHERIMSFEWANKCKNLKQLLSEIDGLDSDSPASPRLISLPWEDDNWYPSLENINSYKPDSKGDAPEMIRLGRILQAGSLSFHENSELLNNIPAFAPIRNLVSDSKLAMPGHIVIFSNDAKSRKEALSALESVALRLISTFPIRRVRGTFIDPVSMGNSFPFNSLPNFIVGQQTYTRSEDVKEQLRKLTIHVEQVIQNYLSRYYQTIEDYNTEKSAIVEPYRYLCVADFPTSFDSSSWEDLKSLLVNGAKAGAYGIIHVDETLDRPRNFNYEIFKDSCTVIRPTDKLYKDKVVFSMRIPTGLECKITLDEPPPNEKFNLITSAINEVFKSIKTDVVSFADIYPQELWSGDSRKEIRASIGITGARNHVEFWMGNNEDGLVATSGLLAGKPGAGKSYTLHAIINGLAMKYPPSELEMYLLDFKEGVEFQVYINPQQSSSSGTEDLTDKSLPHARVISVESDREFGLSVLQKVQKEIEERANKFKTPGVNVENLQQYREKTGELMPRILVVIDEFQYMFQDRDKITDSLNLIFEDITRRGRAFGIHLLIASQSPNVPNMSNRIYSYIDLRMAMQMNRDTASSVLAEGNTDAVDLLDRPGKLIYNSDLGRKGSNSIGQVADVSQEERVRVLLHIQEKVARDGYRRSNSLIVFNGNQPSKLSNNDQLLKMSMMDKWLDSSDVNKQIVQNQDWFPQEFPSVFWLGESMRIGNHTQSIFRRRQRSNMLIVGAVEENIAGMLAGVLISLVHNYKPQQASFHLIDLFQSSGNDDGDYSNMSSNFSTAFQEFFPVEIGKRFAEPDKGVDKSENVLRKAFDEFEVRLAKRKKDPDDLNLGEPYFLVCAIGSLNRAQYLRPVAGRSREEPSEDAQKFMNLLSQGAELGIHTILWVDNTKTFQQIFTDSRSIWGSFDMRIGLAMPENDSRDLLGEGYAKNLPPMRAYFRDMMLTEGPEKFKPYAVPSFQEMNKYNHLFKNRLMRGQNV